MNIAKALKEKNKKVNELNDLTAKIIKNNSIPKGDPREYDVKKLVQDSISTAYELAELKSKIHIASQQVRLRIFEMAELKNLVSKLKMVSTKTGTERSGYHGGDSIEMEAAVKTIEMEEMIADLEARIENLQEQLDDFNHSTQI